MTWREDEQPKRHTLTPIGDEAEFHSHPLEVGEPTEMDLVRRRTLRIERLLPRPKSRPGRIVHGLILFGIILAAVAGLAYLVGLFLEHEGVSHNDAMLIVFLIGGAAIASPVLVIWPGLPVRAYRYRRSAQPPGDDSADEYDLPKYGMWQFHWAFWLALGAGLLLMGFAIWGRGSQEPDYYLSDLAGLVAPDWGRQSANCHRSHGDLSLCTVQGVSRSDRFQVCVRWRMEPRPLLVYSPLRRCGVDVSGITTPSTGVLRYRASATAACLRRAPDVEILLFRTVPGGTELRVAFQPLRGVRSLADAFFLKDEAAAERWHPRAPATGYRRRNVVVQWGNSRPAYLARFNACLKS